MPDHDRRREPVGSVAEETARLVEALGGWAQGVATDHRSAPGARAQGTGDVPGAGDVPGGRHEAGRPQTGRCEQCGSTTRAGEAAACQLCPICQGIAMLRAVRPETVERLADLAAALSGTLRDIAAERTRQGPAPTPPRGQRVQDIDVDDDDVPRAGGAADSRASAGGRSTNGRTDPMSTTSSSQESAAP